MHEASVMLNVIEAVVKQVPEGTRVVEVNLVLGELTFLGHEQMEFAFEVMSADTPLEGAILKLGTEATRVSCPSCGYKGDPARVELDDARLAHTGVMSFGCPSCGARVDIIEGKDVVIRQLIFEEAEGTDTTEGAGEPNGQ